MNIRKIEADFLKGLFSTQSSKYVMTDYEGKVGYSDSYFIAFVPKKDAFVRDDHKAAFDVKTFITDIYNHFIADYSYTVSTPFGNLARYDRVDERNHAYIDVKYTKYFDKTATYYVKNYKSPVLVYEDDGLVGIICPVNFHEGVK